MPPDHPPYRASVQKLFITGLLTLLPIWLTWVVIKFVFVLLSDISKPWVEPLSHRIAATFPQSLGWFNGLWVQNTIAMVATLFVILAVGTILGWGLVVNTAANWLTWQGYLLFLIGGKDGSWASANLGVIVALLVGLFGALAFQRGDIAKQEADLPASETADAIEAK